jgi:hypothetical protein
MKIQHGYEDAAWTDSMDMDMQHGQRNGCCMDMNMFYGDEHAAWTIQ